MVKPVRKEFIFYKDNLLANMFVKTHEQVIFDFEKWEGENPKCKDWPKASKVGKFMSDYGTLGKSDYPRFNKLFGI